VVNLESPWSLLILAESLEGSTYFGDDHSTILDGLQSRQKSAANKKAAENAADKIAKLLGRAVIPALT
jgi:hypothetical protein